MSSNDSPRHPFTSNSQLHPSNNIGDGSDPGDCPSANPSSSLSSSAITGLSSLDTDTPMDSDSNANDGRRSSSFLEAGGPDRQIRSAQEEPLRAVGIMSGDLRSPQATEEFSSSTDASRTNVTNDADRIPTKATTTATGFDGQSTSMSGTPIPSNSASMSDSAPRTLPQTAPGLGSGSEQLHMNEQMQMSASASANTASNASQEEGSGFVNQFGGPTDNTLRQPPTSHSAIPSSILQQPPYSHPVPASTTTSGSSSSSAQMPSASSASRAPSPSPSAPSPSVAFASNPPSDVALDRLRQEIVRRLYDAMGRNGSSSEGEGAPAGFPSSRPDSGLGLGSTSQEQASSGPSLTAPQIHPPSRTSAATSTSLLQPSSNADHSSQSSGSAPAPTPVQTQRSSTSAPSNGPAHGVPGISTHFFSFGLGRPGDENGPGGGMQHLGSTFQAGSPTGADAASPASSSSPAAPGGAAPGPVPMGGFAPGGLGVGGLPLPFGMELGMFGLGAGPGSRAVGEGAPGAGNQASSTRPTPSSTMPSGSPPVHLMGAGPNLPGLMSLFPQAAAQGGPPGQPTSQLFGGHLPTSTQPQTQDQARQIGVPGQEQALPQQALSGRAPPNRAPDGFMFHFDLGDHMHLPRGTRQSPASPANDGAPVPPAQANAAQPGIDGNPIPIPPGGQGIPAAAGGILIMGPPGAPPLAFFPMGGPPGAPGGPSGPNGLPPGMNIMNILQMLQGANPRASVAPDPERAKELLAGLKDPGIDLVMRLDRVLRAESGGTPNGVEGGEGWKCAICMEGLDDDEIAAITGEQRADATPSDLSRSVSLEDVEMKDVENVLSGEQAEEQTHRKTGLKAFPCHHIYHEACLEPWLQSKTTCPACRFDIDPLSTTLRLPPQRSNPLRPAFTRNTAGDQRHTPYGNRGNGPSSRPGTPNGQRPSSTPPGAPNSNQASGTGDNNAGPVPPVAGILPMFSFGIPPIGIAPNVANGSPVASPVPGFSAGSSGNFFGGGARHTTFGGSSQPNLAATSSEEGQGTPLSEDHLSRTGELFSRPDVPSPSLGAHPDPIPTPSPLQGPSSSSTGPGSQGGQAQQPDGSFRWTGPAPRQGEEGRTVEIVFQFGPHGPIDAPHPHPIEPPGANPTPGDQPTPANVNQNPLNSGPSPPPASGNDPPGDASGSQQPAPPAGSANESVPGQDQPGTTFTLDGPAASAFIASLLNAVIGMAGPGGPQQQEQTVPNPSDAPAADGEGAQAGMRMPPSANPNASNGGGDGGAAAFAAAAPDATPASRRRSIPRVRSSKEWIIPSVKETLSDWVSNRERALHWRCDDPVCIYAPPEHYSDIGLDGEWRSWQPTSQEVIPVRSMEELETVHHHQSDENDDNTQAEEAIKQKHRCGHRFHPQCLKISCLSSNWWVEDPREQEKIWLRCPKCRKQGWVTTDEVEHQHRHQNQDQSQEQEQDASVGNEGMTTSTEMQY